MKHAFGAEQSHHDPRTVEHTAMAVSPLIKGGVHYSLNEIENQWYVGICTAISVVQNQEKANGKKYSPDFHYLLQKKFYANLVSTPWVEGSSIFMSLKVAKNYGFLPLELWTHTTEADRQLPYDQYVAKLSSIPDAEVNRLISLCTDKIAGYAKVDVSNDQSISKAIQDSGTGILCCFTVGKEWYTPSNPLVPATEIIGYHAINMTAFDYTSYKDNTLTNTWGAWNTTGTAETNFINYKPIEAWIILKTPPTITPMYKYFKLTEPAGNHTVAELKPDLVAKLDIARGYAGIPFKLTSGFRTAAENTACGGVPNSAHLTAEAVDISCVDSNARMLIVQSLLKAGFNRIEVCPAHVHCDISTTLPQNVLVLSQNG